MKNPKAILHIGTHKTGTTALQNFFRSNFDALLNKNLFWIDSSYNFPTDWKNQVKNGGRVQLDDLNRKFKEIYVKSQQSSKSLLLSSEGYCGWPQTGYSEIDYISSSIKKLLELFDVKVILYCRRQDLFYESLYVQQIQQGESLSFDEFWNSISYKNINYAKLIERYSTLFGKSNLIVRPYVKNELYGNNVITDFFHRIKVELNDQFNFNVWGNKGINAAALKISRIMNGILNDSNEKNKLRGILQSTNPKNPFESNNFMLPQQRREILSFFEDFNLKLSHQWFGVDSNIFQYKEEDNPKTKISESLTIEELVEVNMKIFLKLLNQKNPPS